MAQETFTGEQFFAELEALGEPKVGEFVAAGRWGKVGPRFELAKEWLRQKAELRRTASESEQTEIARSAKDAAWAAAEAAKEAAVAAREAAREAKAANTRTTIMLAITVISIIVTIVTAYLRPS
jgi:hypothetical protein